VTDELEAIEVGDAKIMAEGLARRFDGDPGVTLRFGKVAIPRGGIVAVIGTSGVGKTTLLHILAGIDPTHDTSGAWAKLFEEPDTAPIDLLDWRRYPRHLVSSIFQRGFLLGNASVGENIEIPMKLAGIEPSPDDAVTFLIEAGLPREEAEIIRNRRPRQISGGQQQRVAISRAVARQPRLIFADEPTSNLDEAARDKMMYVLDIWRDGAPDRTLVLVTHDLELVAQWATHVLLMEVVDDSDHTRDIAVRPIAAGREVDFYRAALWPKEGAPRVESAGDLHAAPNIDAPPRVASRPRQAQWVIAGRLARAELFKRAGDQKATPFNFTRWVEVGITMLSIVVATAMAVALWANYERLQSVTSDPSNCSLEVTPLRTDDGRSRIGKLQLDEMAARPWAPAAPSDSRTERASGDVNPCRTGPAVFARHDVTQIFMNEVGASGQCSRSGLSIALLSTTINDPVLASSIVIETPDPITVQTGRTLTQTFKDPLLLGRSFVFLSIEMQRRLQEAGMDTAPSHICLARGAGQPERFAVGGWVDKLPAPRLRAFEVMIPEPAYVQFAFGGDTPDSIPAMQLYFDPGGLWRDGTKDAVREYLDGRFGFRLDDLEKTARLRDEARVSVIALAALALFNFLLFLGLSYSITLNYMRANAPQLAVLRTFGLHFGTAMLQNFRVLLIALGIAVVLLSVIFLGLAPLFPLAFGAGVEITQIEVLVVFFLVIVLNATVALAAAALATRAWWMSGRLLSELIE
jgi:putative ABC transport system ATP-binding protein